VAEEPRVRVEIPCPRCDGAGLIPDQDTVVDGVEVPTKRPCPECGEYGWLEQTMTLSELREAMGL
jgi:endogenous inhibitor of DNA gyrase (YacG/DUF329 family)